jgi:hypothetical protein
MLALPKTSQNLRKASGKGLKNEESKSNVGNQVTSFINNVPTQKRTVMALTSQLNAAFTNHKKMTRLKADSSSGSDSSDSSSSSDDSDSD